MGYGIVAFWLPRRDTRRVTFLGTSRSLGNIRSPAPLPNSRSRKLNAVSHRTSGDMQ